MRMFTREYSVEARARYRQQRHMSKSAMSRLIITTRRHAAQSAMREVPYADAAAIFATPTDRRCFRQCRHAADMLPLCCHDAFACSFFFFFTLLSVAERCQRQISIY